MKYGNQPGQLEGMPPGSLADVIVSSPPYAGAGEVLGTHNGIDYSKVVGSGRARTLAREASGLNYGSTAGQLGAMPAGTPPSAEGISIPGRKRSR